MQVADAFVKILADTTGFGKDLEKKAGTEIDRVAPGMGTRFGSKFKTTAGALIGGAFGIAIAGAQQLDTATRKLQADAGLTADEAAKASHSLAGLYRSNLQGYAAIGDAMAKVRTDLGLTGEEADRVTKKFLRFSTATGQDAAQAVMSFDDVLDAWGLTANDAQGIMDALVVSHQKYGGVIADNLSTLSALAPSMKAANFRVEDAIGLLNLFASKGVDANVATLAFQKALTKVKSPQELKVLLADIAATEDPFLRSQKAADLFGSRAGAKLGLALEGANLDDFVVSMDDAAGATEKAADAIESSWGARFQLLLKNAGGALAEFGSNFGPLLLVASALGPKMITAVGAALGGLTTVLPKMIGKSIAGAIIPTDILGAGAGAKATGLGRLMGGKIGAGIKLGLAGVAIFAVGYVADQINQGLAKQEAALLAKTNAFAKKATEAELAQAQRGIDAARKELDKTFDFGIFTSGARESLDQMQSDLDARMAEIGASAGKSLADGTTAERGTVLVAAEDVVKTFGTSLSGVVRAARQTGADGMAAMAQAISDARSKPVDAFGTLVEMMKNPMTRAQEIARLTGQLTSKALADGIRSKDEEIRAQALATRQLILDRLAELAGTSANGTQPLGTAAAKAIATGMKSADPEIRAAAEAAAKIIEDRLAGTAATAADAGTAAGKAYGLAMLEEVGYQLQRLGERGGDATPPKPTPKTPRGITPYASGSWMIPSDRLALVHAGEMVIPAAESAAVRAGRASVTSEGVGGSPGASISVVVNNPVPEPASTSISREMRKLAYMGVVG